MKAGKCICKQFKEDDTYQYFIYENNDYELIKWLRIGNYVLGTNKQDEKCLVIFSDCYFEHYHCFKLVKGIFIIEYLLPTEKQFMIDVITKKEFKNKFEGK